MPLMPHQVLDYIQSGKVFVAKPRPIIEDDAYLNLMSAWYNEKRKELPAVECFDIEIDLDKLRKTDWNHVGDTTQLLIEVSAYRLPYPSVWLSFPAVSYHLTEHYDQQGDYYIKSQAFIKEQAGNLAVCTATVRLYPCVELSKRDGSQRIPGGLAPMRDDEDSDTGLHAEVELMYASNEITEDEKVTLEKFAALHTSVFLSMLNTRGVPRERIEAPIKLNRARAKKHKAPVLTVTRVSLPKGLLERREKPEGASRRSPRLHWRRGHKTSRWRTDGQWIEPCVVGLPESGFSGRKKYGVGTGVPLRYETDLLTGDGFPSGNFAHSDLPPVLSPHVTMTRASEAARLNSPKEITLDQP